MKLFTIGFTKKSARQFFGLLIDNGVKNILDVRLNNNSQLAGFTKGSDLPYLLDKIGDISYNHCIHAAPTKDLLDNWKKGAITWSAYEEIYLDLLEKRNFIRLVERNELENGCLLCSEPTTDHCHRRLLAEYLKKHLSEIQITHL